MKYSREDFAHKISETNSVVDLRTAFMRYMEQIGLDIFTYQVVRHNFHHNLSNFYVTNYPEEWEQRYLSQNYFNDDPFVKQYFTSKDAFTWGKDKAPVVTNRTKQMFAEAAEFNLDCGIGIPIPGAANSFSVMTFGSSSCDMKEVEKINSQIGKDIMIATLLFHSSFISLNLQNAMHQQHELTNKEADCLKLICIGKSYSDIAYIYGVSESAIKKRALNIYSKIGVSNRHEAVLKTFKYKIVEI